MLPNSTNCDDPTMASPFPPKGGKGVKGGKSKGKSPPPKGKNKGRPLPPPVAPPMRGPIASAMSGNGLFG